ncbi:MAG TPA: FAD-dependent oxidoreductase [Thermoanaerobaculia bacterium]|nr:FAD-dependent oxidoreductase [Thermoanaerobaculia bacterium]
MNLAIVGTGISGLGAAWRLHERHDVRVFERERRPGGHSHTVDVPGSRGAVPVDTGFLVYNEVTYPNLVKLFATLGVPTKESDMSFSVRCERCDLEWCGTGLSGVFAQPANLLKPSFHGMLLEIARFNREAPRLLEERGAEALTLAAYLDRERYGAAFRNHYLIPMAASVWSSGPAAMETFPAATLVRFFRNHGFLGVTTQLRWRTVDGGSREYVKRLTEPFRDRLHLGNGVTRVRRDAHGVELVFADGGSQRFDGVLIATHADDALAMLEGPTADEKRLLGAWSFSSNETLLHSDRTFLPLRRGARASWNYHLEDCERPWGSATLHYFLNRLQGLPTETDWIVSLNPRREPAEGTVARRLLYTHPVYTPASVATQAELPSLNGKRRTWFAGAWFGYGFHEDGLRSGLEAAVSLGAEPL